jgi:hypothetical protein
VGPSAGLDGCGKSRPHRDFFLSLDRPVRSQSLYLLSYRWRNGGKLLQVNHQKLTFRSNKIPVILNFFT